MDNTREARIMLRKHRYGVLSTLSKKFNGHPFGSITPYLVDHDGSLLVLISSLAEHTKNIISDPRVSLICHNQHDTNIQAQGRITVVGNAEIATNCDLSKSRYLRYFPESEAYFQTHDFSFYRIQPLAIRNIGGFGRIHWVEMKNYLISPYPLIEQELAVISHMNADHQKALLTYCQHYHQYAASDVTMLGIDLDGFDIRADSNALRFDFTQPVTDAQEARRTLIEMMHHTPQ